MPTKPELERALEQRCVAKVEARGGLALKLRLPTGRGFPDRTILVAGHEPIVFFIEFKRSKTGAVSTQQHKWRTLLFQAGFKTYFVDSDEKFEAALKAEGVW